MLILLPGQIGDFLSLLLRLMGIARRLLARMFTVIQQLVPQPRLAYRLLRYIPTHLILVYPGLVQAMELV